MRLLLLLALSSNVAGSTTSQTLRRFVSNPLLRISSLPRFAEIRPAHLEEAVDQLVELVEERLLFLEQSTGFSEVIEPLEDINFFFSKILGPVEHLLLVDNSEELRSAYKSVLPTITALKLRLLQDQGLYRKLTELSKDRTLSTVQQRLVEMHRRRMFVGGITLGGQDRQRFNKISEELEQLQHNFSDNVLDAIKEFQLVLTTKSDIAGLPETFLQSASQNYRRMFDQHSDPQSGPWLVTIDRLTYRTFMEYSERRDLRQKLYQAQIEIASHRPYDNLPVLKRILEIRQEIAQLLGYNDYASLILENKMAGNVETVKNLFNDLQQKIAGQARKEIDELTAFANENDHLGKLELWDMDYWRQKLQDHRSVIDSEQLRNYYPYSQVLAGLFAFSEHLFAIDIRQNNSSETQKWHDDVSFYDVYDRVTAERIASFYLDPYSRPASKSGGAWVGRCVSRDSMTQPVCYVVTNFTPPAPDQPALLTLDNVRTLFHEFGHAFHNMLTETIYHDISGTAGVERDAVELPSKFMENFQYLDSVKHTRHIESGEPLSAEILAKLRDKKKFNAATTTLKQLFYSQLDLQLHDGTFTGDDPLAFMHQLAEQILPAPLHVDDKFLASFRHIFSIGYVANYYSYKWSEILSADLFEMYQERGFSVAGLRAMGKELRETIFAVGGGQHASDIFYKLRGRQPKIDALLKEYGFAE